MKTSLFILVLLFPMLANATIMINASRLVMNKSDRETSLLIKNTGDYPVVIQSWIDNGDPAMTPENASDAPAMVLPALFRLEPDAINNLRIINKFTPTLNDRESLYWLNIYEISPRPANEANNDSYINVTVRLQVKLFYRPDNLTMAINDVSNRLSFSKNSDESKIIINNPTPFYVTFSAADLTVGNKEQSLSIPMIAPFSTQEIEVEAKTVDQIKYSIIDDIGGFYSDKKKIN
nr:molecular chaperone [uncultured Moellerella sp.]